MIVVDASAVVEWVLRSAAGGTVTRHLEEHENALHAPNLILVESANALRRIEARRLIDGHRADLSFEAIRTLRMTRHDPWPLMGRAWSLRNALTSYDAVYVALAESLRVPLLTCDARLARSNGHTADITLAG